VGIYELYRAEFFPGGKSKLCLGINPSGQAVPCSNLTGPAEDNRSPALNTDLESILFKYMPSVEDQLNFARTNKTNYKALHTLYSQKYNLTNYSQLKKLREDGLSEIRIFQTFMKELNESALNFLGPNAMASVEKGVLSIKEAEEKRGDFYKEENISKMKKEDQVVEQYHRDGLLSEADIAKMTPENKSLLTSRLAQFAINSRQLEIEQVFEKRDLLHENCEFDTIRRKVYFNLRLYFLFSKLTVKRYLELDTPQVRFITSILDQCIEEDEITVESALFLLELMDTYKKSGWYGLSLRLTPDNQEGEA